MKRKIIAATMATAMLLSMAAPTAYAEDIVVGATAVETPDAAAPAETDAAAPAPEATESIEAPADTYDAADVPVAINADNFPDANFRDYVLENFDKDKNKSLSAEEISDVKSIVAYNRDITSLKGIEYFTALTTLNCGYNKLTSLDVSKNTALVELYCYENQLTSLDVSNNLALKALGCTDNRLTSLDVSKNTELTDLSCGGAYVVHNIYESLDLSNNTALTKLDCGYARIPSLDLSKNTELTSLNCEANQLTELDLSNNKKLETLFCGRNRLTALDLSNNPNLSNFNCEMDRIVSLDLSKNQALEYVNCSFNRLRTLNMSNNAKLVSLECSDNVLSSLDVSKNTKLNTLRCGSNELSDLDVSNNQELQSLVCYSNRLTTLDLSKNTALREFGGVAQRVIHEFENNGKKLNIANIVGKENLTRITGINSDIDYDSLTGIASWAEERNYCSYKYKTNAPDNVTDQLEINVYSSEQVEIHPIDANYSGIAVGESVVFKTELPYESTCTWSTAGSTSGSLIADITQSETDPTQCTVKGRSAGEITLTVTTDKEFVGRYIITVVGAEPTATPSAQPTSAPSAQPTSAPSAQPTAVPTIEPSAQPTAKPTTPANPDDNNGGTGDNDDNTNTGTDTTPYTPNTEGTTGFVDRLYSVCLGRPADAAGQADWVSQLTSYQISGTKAAYGFIFSQEFTNMNYSNADFVEHLYEAFMGRASDEGGKADWVGKLDAGTSREEVFNGFANSVEFDNICKSYGIVSKDIETFVTRLYSVCLDRQPDDAGLADWANQLRSQTISGKAAASGFVFSEEFTNKNYSNADYVEHLYAAFMGRASDEAGKTDWVSKLDAGTSREEVFNGFAGSAEFDNICASYGIVRG